MKKAYIDLHIHLDGSLNLKWQYNQAIKVGLIPSSLSFEKYYEMMHPGQDSSSTMFDKYDMPLDVMQDKKSIHDCVYEFCREQARLGVIYNEFRFGPSLLGKKGLSQEEAILAAIEGCKDGERDFNIKARIINCFLHRGDSAKVNHELNYGTLLATKKLLGKYVLGVDLAGYENNCDLNEYRYLYEEAQKLGVPYTIHAGEMGNGENILKAIAMNTKRIGHGINAVQDEAYIKALLDNDITLEVCPTSNCNSFGYTYANHPIHKLYEKGVKLTINTDDGTFDNNNLPYEFDMLRNVGFTDEQFLEFTMNAIDAALCSEEEKEELRKAVLD